MNRYFCRWQHDGTLDRLRHALDVRCREKAARETSLTAATIDSQSVKSAEEGARRIDPPGFDGGKKIRGKKRHVLVDKQSLLMDAIVHAADLQDRDGGVLLMTTLFGMYPFLLELYADAATRDRSSAGPGWVCPE